MCKLFFFKNVINFRLFATKMCEKFAYVKKIYYLCAKFQPIMDKYTPIRSQNDIHEIASNGVLVCIDQQGRTVPPNVDITYPYIIITLTVKGMAHCLYDMKDMRSFKNDLAIFLPGHIIRPLEHSEDYMQTWLLFDPAKYADSEKQFNPKEFETLYNAPLCHLTDEQAEYLSAVVRMIQFIVSRTEEELPNKHRLLEAQLTVAYDLYMSIRRNQDLEWEKDRTGQLYLQFCDLVVAHYKEERNVNYYAEALGYDPRYFSKIFRDYNNGLSPLAWIQNYISTQAKRIMNDNPDCTVKEVAFQLGFPTTANFCRYFKRATGMTPQEYRHTFWKQKGENW